MNHQLTSIPEASQLSELTARRKTLDNALRDLRVQIDDLTAEQKRADADVEQVKTRRVRDQSMIDAGQIKDPKALERMLGELQSLHRRISDLEDVEIEVMERLEEAQQALDRYTTDLAALETEIATVEAAYEKTSGDLQAQLAAREGRARHGGVGDAGGPDHALREAARPEGRGRGGGAAPSRVRRLSADPERL